MRCAARRTNDILEKEADIADVLDHDPTKEDQSKQPKPSAKKKPAKRPYSVTLSPKSELLLDELKEFTDAETVTEVFRDALRLSYLVMKAQKTGLRVEITDPADPNGRSTIIGVGVEIPG